MTVNVLAYAALMDPELFQKVAQPDSKFETRLVYVKDTQRFFGHAHIGKKQWQKYSMKMVH